MLVIFVNIFWENIAKFFFAENSRSRSFSKKNFFSKNNFFRKWCAIFFYIRNFLIQKNVSIFTKVIKLLKTEIEKLTSNFSLPIFNVRPCVTQVTFSDFFHFQIFCRVVHSEFRALNLILIRSYSYQNLWLF